MLSLRLRPKGGPGCRFVGQHRAAGRVLLRANQSAARDLKAGRPCGCRALRCVWL